MRELGIRAQENGQHMVVRDFHQAVEFRMEERFADGVELDGFDTGRPISPTILSKRPTSIKPGRRFASLVLHMTQFKLQAFVTSMPTRSGVSRAGSS